MRLVWSAFCGLFAGAFSGVLLLLIGKAIFGESPIWAYVLAAWVLFWVAVFIKERSVDY